MLVPIAIILGVLLGSLSLIFFGTYFFLKNFKTYIKS